MSDRTQTGFWFKIVNLLSLTEQKQLTQVDSKPKELDHGATYAQPYGVRPTYDPAKAMSAYAGHGYTYAAVSRASQDLAALPIRLLKGKDKTVVEDHPVLDLLDQPSTNCDGFLFREQLCTDLILTGNCFILLLGQTEKPSSVVRLHPENVRISTNQTGIEAYIYDSSGQMIAYPPERIVHGRLASWKSGPEELLGTGAVEPLARELTADINSQNLVSNASAKARPDLLISPKDPADIWGPEVRREIAQEYKKLSAGGGAMVLSGLAEVEPLQLSPREMEYVEARKMARESISAVTGVPPTVLGLPAANFATSRQQAKNYWTVQVKRGKRLAMLFTAIARKWDEDFVIEHDYAGVEALQETRTEQLNRVTMHILNGISPKAAYKYEGLQYPEDIEEPVADYEDETAEDARAYLAKVYNLATLKDLSTYENRREAFNSLNENTQKALKKKADEHKEEVGDDPKKQTDKFILAVSYLRGIGAYESNPQSVRPTVSSAEQWAMGRVNGLLYALRNLKFRRTPYDTDLLPEEHPLSTRGEDEEKRHLLFGYKGLKKAPKETNWGFTKREADKLLEDDNFDRYGDSFLFVYKGREDDPNGYRLPIAKMIDGEPQIVFRGVIAASSALRKQPKFRTGYYNLNGISDRDIKRLYGIIEDLYKEFDEEAPPLEETKAVGDIDPTNFPVDGDDESVSLTNSQFEIFDFEYAEDLKENYPAIWRAGGNIEGNNQYRRLLPIARRRSKAPTTDTEEMAIRKREAWSARHFEDGMQFDKDEPPSPNISSIAGIIAQIKWLTVGKLGQARMKEIIDIVKQKQTKEKARHDLWKMWLRSYHEPAEKDLQRAANAYLRGAAKRYADRAEEYVTPSKTKGVIDFASLLDTNTERALIAQVIGSKWRKWYFVSGGNALKEIMRLAGLPVDEMPLSEDLANDYIDTLAKQLVITQENAVKRIIEDGLMDGLPVPTIAKNIQAATGFGFARARLIARTEATKASALGSQQAFSQAAADGINVRKQWLSARDDKVRDSHADLDGFTVGVNEEFISITGATAAGPAQFGEPAEDINCRCVVIPVVGD
tara:strand:+ start:2428 stop:5625 length:3198 start_codon:yes stop_codon:yes gene_type:complete